jgi:hypothetical protein
MRERVSDSCSKAGLPTRLACADGGAAGWRGTRTLSLPSASNRQAHAASRAAPRARALLSCSITNARPRLQDKRPGRTLTRRLSFTP